MREDRAEGRVGGWVGGRGGKWWVGKSPPRRVHSAPVPPRESGGAVGGLVVDPPVALCGKGDAGAGGGAVGVCGLLRLKPCLAAPCRCTGRCE